MRTEEKKNENVIEITEEVSISQEDGSTIVLEAGDRIQIIREQSNMADQLSDLRTDFSRDSQFGEAIIDVIFDTLVNELEISSMQIRDIKKGMLKSLQSAEWSL